MRRVFLIYMLGFIESTWEAQWTYEDERHWPGACSSGRQQSPINIITENAVLDHTCDVIKSPLRFRGYKKVPLSGRNNGHTLEWKVSPGSSATLSGGPLLDEYRFIQFHLHWISEHAIDGAKTPLVVCKQCNNGSITVRYPMEIHLVHIKAGLSEATVGLHPDSIAVVGIPVQIKEDCADGEPFESVMRDISRILNNTEILPTRDVDVKSLLSPDPESFYTYRGSLTTPNCGENVIWIVNDVPTFISGEKYKLITQTKIGSTTNFRALQPLNYRLVYKTANSCSGMQPSFLAIVGSLVHCATITIGQMFNRGYSYFFDLRRRYLSRQLSP